jgi:hypothetical protein
MTAITSQTFHPAPALSLQGAFNTVFYGARAAAQLIARAFAAGNAPARRQDRTGEAEEVRSMARAWEKTDPGFAADLYAAAARHEGLSD